MIDNFTVRHLTTQNTSISTVQRIRNEVNLVSDIIKPAIQGIFYTAAGALFTYAYGYSTQQKSYKDGYIDGHMEGYNKGYSEGFNQGNNENSNQTALIAGAACIGAIFGVAAMNYFQRKQQNTQIVNVQINQAISNHLAE